MTAPRGHWSLALTSKSSKPMIIHTSSRMLWQIVGSHFDARLGEIMKTIRVSCLFLPVSHFSESTTENMLDGLACRENWDEWRLTRKRCRRHDLEDSYIEPKIQAHMTISKAGQQKAAKLEEHCQQQASKLLQEHPIEWSKAKVIPNGYLSIRLPPQGQQNAEKWTTLVQHKSSIHHNCRLNKVRRRMEGTQYDEGLWWNHNEDIGIETDWVALPSKRRKWGSML
jgi:hypothetical protein